MTTRRNFLKQSLLAAGVASPCREPFSARENGRETPQVQSSLQEHLPEGTLRDRERVPDGETGDHHARNLRGGQANPPDPTWSGHEKEIEMYRKAWQIGIGKHQGPGTGFRFRMQLPRCRLQRQYLHVGLRLHDDVRPFRYPLLPLPTYVR